ncbi:acyltransferase domain-containing protein [Kribbella sp. NPDC026611]|uniref:acyltransferase domain-containing protein n=1 Tax=Kribbella sp. NPDC026611 TaxID=3154911 RepID=UPI0033D3C9A7
MRSLRVGDGLPDDVDGWLTYCGVSDADRRDMLAARPEVGSEWSSEVGLFAWAWALLAGLPRLRDLHARRGVPDEVTRATVSMLGGVMGTHRQVTGRAGVGLLELWSPPLRMRGAEYEIGRLAFGRAHLGLGDGVSGYVLMVHIPPGGSLDARAAEESIQVAATSFRQWYPEEPISGFVCSSWLLDPQLAEYLGPESNIVRFQQRFDLLPLLPPDDHSDGDRELMSLGLHLQEPDHPLTEDDLAQIPQDTTLQRAFVAHLRGGRHWYQRTGMLKGHGLAG